MKSISRTAFVAALYGHKSVFLGKESGNFHEVLLRVRKAIEGNGLSTEYARTCIHKGDGRHLLKFDDGSALCIDQKGQEFMAEEENNLLVREIGNTRVWYWVCD